MAEAATGEAGEAAAGAGEADTTSSTMTEGATKGAEGAAGVAMMMDISKGVAGGVMRVEGEVVAATEGSQGRQTGAGTGAGAAAGSMTEDTTMTEAAGVEAITKKAAEEGAEADTTLAGVSVTRFIAAVAAAHCVEAACRSLSSR